MRRDSTFLLQNRFYAAPPDLAGQTIEVRFDPLDPASAQIYFQGEPAVHPQGRKDRSAHPGSPG